MQILIVDDERSIERLFLQRFRKEIRTGLLALHFAFSGAAALDFLANNDWSDLLILSDVNMPNMSGLELLKIVKREYPSLKVYMLTAYSDEKNRQQALVLGANDFLNKPVDFKLLKEKILTAL